MAGRSQMPKTTSVHHAAGEFLSESTKVKQLVSQSRSLAAQAGLGRAFEASFYEYGITRLHAAFESFILKAMVAVVNQRPSVLASKTGVWFPRHMYKKACEYVVTGGGYFDIRGRPGLLQKLKRLLPDDHYLVQVVERIDYRPALEQLWALRNFAVHRSEYAKDAARDAVGQKKIPSAGVWLSKYNRFNDIADSLDRLVGEVRSRAHH